MARVMATGHGQRSRPIAMAGGHNQSASARVTCKFARDPHPSSADLTISTSILPSCEHDRNGQTCDFYDREVRRARRAADRRRGVRRADTRHQRGLDGRRAEVPAHHGGSGAGGDAQGMTVGVAAPVRPVDPRVEGGVRGSQYVVQLYSVLSRTAACTRGTPKAGLRFRSRVYTRWLITVFRAHKHATCTSDGDNMDMGRQFPFPPRPDRLPS